MQFVLNNQTAKDNFKQWVNNLFMKYADTAKNFYIDIKEGSEIRSVEQNKYYWSIVVEIAQAIIKETEGRDLSNELTHENLKYNFGTQVFSEETYWTWIYNSKVITVDEFNSLPYMERNKCLRVFLMPSTAKMTKKQFNQYVQLIQEWAAFLGYEIPEPKQN